MNALQQLRQAREQGYALGAFNAGNLEIARAVFQAAREGGSPVIVEVSPNELEHFGLSNFLSVVENFRRDWGGEILTNLDHGQGLEDCQRAVEAGFNLVHFDGSGLAYEENLKITKALVEIAHSRGVLIEGEIDRILGSSTVHEETAEVVQNGAAMTDPQKAADFVRQTGCDILAVFVGNLHGSYASEEHIDLGRLGEIKEGVDCFLSLHGGSGLADDEVKAAIKAGVVKVNINTQLRSAFRSTLENVLKGSDEAAVYKIMLPVIAAVQAVVAGKMELLGSVGKTAASEHPPELQS